MNNAMKIFLSIVLIYTCFITSFVHGNEKETLYQLKVKIEPASGIMECKVEIKNPNDSCFTLNKDMEIQSISADGLKVSFHRNPSNFMPNSTEIIVESKIPNKLLIEYSGKIIPENYPPIFSSVNMITPQLVELAIYASWYPRLKHGSVNFEMEADLPSDYITITNGILTEQKTNSNRSITMWKSFSPGFDIALIAAPGLKKTEVSQNGVTVEIYYDKVPETYIDSMKSNLVKSMNQHIDLLGVPVNKLIRVAYSPRTTWAYVRTPLIIVSQGNALDWRAQKFGPARDFRCLTHEISHYWWNMADMNTPDDWLNEGLAEYSAFLISEEVIGKDFTDQLLSEYKGRAENCKTETPIVETGGNSPDREVNRYDKPTILFNELSRKYSKEKLHKFLKALYTRFKETKIVNTPAFLDEMEKQLGTDAKEYFSNALYIKKWDGDNILQSKAD